MERFWGLKVGRVVLRISDVIRLRKKLAGSVQDWPG